MQSGWRRVGMKSAVFITRNGNATTTYRIRVVPLEGNPWFLVMEACRALGSYVRDDGRINTTAALRSLPAEAVRKLATVEANRIGLKVRGPHGVMLISEAGLYELIARSNKPEARAFKDWVFGEVLPTIRKTGGYVLQGADRATVGEGTVAEMPDVAGALRVL